MRAVALFDRRSLLAASVPPDARARRALVIELLEAGIAAVDPEACVREALETLGQPPARAVVFAFGKAAIPMARAALERVHPRAGIVIAPDTSIHENDGDALVPLELCAGTHPRPSPRAPEHARRAFAIARAMRADEIALALVSGGGSSLLELPREPLTLEELDRVTSALMRAGACIAELNAVRAALSAIKGGGLAAAIAPHPIVSLVLSDVPGLPAELVASGPTCAPPAGDATAGILARYEIDVPERVQRVLREPRAPRPLGPIRTLLCGDNDRARRAIVAEALRRGRALADREGHFSGEARSLALDLGAEAFVWGGETTVRVAGRGRGGRNHEVVLGAIAAVEAHAGTFACVGTDGIDGASDAAGALIDRHAIARARELGLDPAAALADNASHDFFAALGTQLRSGPTGTNVADLCLYLPD